MSEQLILKGRGFTILAPASLRIWQFADNDTQNTSAGSTLRGLFTDLTTGEAVLL